MTKRLATSTIQIIIAPIALTILFLIVLVFDHPSQPLDKFFSSAYMITSINESNLGNAIDYINNYRPKDAADSYRFLYRYAAFLTNHDLPNDSLDKLNLIPIDQISDQEFLSEIYQIYMANYEILKDKANFKKYQEQFQQVYKPVGGPAD